MSDAPDLSPEAVERLDKMIETLEKSAANAERMCELLQPEFDAFNAKTGHNVYVVRDYVDHRNAAKKQRLEAATLRALSAELTAAREAQTWRPIDSAPHETLVVLGWYETDFWGENGVWKQEIGLASAGSRNSLGYSNRWFHGSATHWMPLSPAPTGHDDSGGV